MAGTTAAAVEAVGPGRGTAQPTPRMPDGKPNLQGVFNSFGAPRGGGPGRGAPPPAGALPQTPTLKPGMDG